MPLLRRVSCVKFWLLLSMGEMTAYFIFNVLLNSPYQLRLCLVTMMILVVVGVGTTGTIADKPVKGGRSCYSCFIADLQLNIPTIYKKFSIVYIIIQHH